MKPKDSPKSIPKSNSNLISLIKPYRGLIALLVILTIIGNSLNLLIPRVVSASIDAYIKGSFVMDSFLIKFCLIAVSIFIFIYLQSIVQTYTSEKAARDLRKNLSLKISRQSYGYIQKITPSKLLTNLTSDVDAVKIFVSQAIAAIVSSIFLIIGASTFLILTNWRLGLAVLTIVPSIGITFFLIMGRVRLLFKKIQEVIDWLNKVINESILGAALIRVLNSQKYEDQKFIDANTQAKETGLKILSYFATLIPIINFVASLASLLILVLGGHYVIQGTMTLGSFAAFNSYVAILIFPIIMLGFMSNVIARSTASYERILQVLNSQEEPETGTVDKVLKGNVDVKNICLSAGEKSILKNVSFSIKAGTKTAIIGPTAAGKTQLLYLLNGLNKPDSGTIKYDGVDLKDYDLNSLHHQLGFVFQDSIVFNLTLKENISFNKNVPDADLEKSIKTSELKGFIDSLPHKLNTVVSERGTSLSGGQKQRIMLARALAVNPKILLLDDFTARVDAQTERQILSNVKKDYPELTLISVTQKIASVKDYNQIILLMEGEVIAKGTHKELMKTSPEYVQLYDSQRSTSHYEVRA